MPYEPLSCVLLADRHTGLTEGVRGLLETAFGTVVIVADETSLLEAASRLQPDVAVVDLSLAQGGGLGWLRAVRERCPDLKVVVISVYDELSVQRAGGPGRGRRLRTETRDCDRPSAHRDGRPRPFRVEESASRLDESGADLDE